MKEACSWEFINHVFNIYKITIYIYLRGPFSRKENAIQKHLNVAPDPLMIYLFLLINLD